MTLIIPLVHLCIDKSWLFWISSISSIQSLSHVWLFVTPWTATHQASLSITNSQSLLKLKSIESVMPSNHLILCRPLLLLPSIFPSIRVFSNESALHIRWPKYWSFSFSISPFNEYSGMISFRKILQSKGFSRVFSSTTVQKHQSGTNYLSMSSTKALSFTVKERGRVLWAKLVSMIIITKTMRSKSKKKFLTWNQNWLSPCNVHSLPSILIKLFRSRLQLLTPPHIASEELLPPILPGFCFFLIAYHPENVSTHLKCEALII